MSDIETSCDTKQNEIIDKIKSIIEKSFEKLESLFDEETFTKNSAVMNKDHLINNLLINGSWGTGKTTLINKLKEKYKQSEKPYPTIFITLNVWKYELLPNITEALLCDFLVKINAKRKEDLNFKKIIKKINIKELMKSLAVLGTNVILERFAGLNLSHFGNSISSIVNSNNPFSYNNQIDLFIECLAKALKPKKKNEKFKLIVVFDEVDRCDESKILNILTIFKNILFQVNSPNIFFIACINKKQIEKILKYENESYIDKIFSNEIQIDGVIPFNDKVHNDYNVDCDDLIYVREWIKNLKISNHREAWKYILNNNEKVPKEQKQIQQLLNFIKNYIYFNINKIEKFDRNFLTPYQITQLLSDLDYFKLQNYKTILIDASKKSKGSLKSFFEILMKSDSIIIPSLVFGDNDKKMKIPLFLALLIDFENVTNILKTNPKYHDDELCLDISDFKKRGNWILWLFYSLAYNTNNSTTGNLINMDSGFEMFEKFTLEIADILDKN
ncbi:P-loop NTPase fold protein [Williamsoniiplasma luminosum]|uniref:KAP NTPase domain-containing protein n=1 Tax=Williamsoniiplasma luminosum TaxID=214888 RepID=A0A2S0NJ23_9MOLU|nr:P-loop NTPase fold protein [Williamsoniiplasma luminosum]AVP49007.1 MAG: hypothetical protein C5T88_00170 [Williamsoniiplasma luminosum]